MKVCRKLISRKLVLRDAEQLKARYVCKTNKSQSVRGSQGQLANHKKSLNDYTIQNNNYFLRCMVIGDIFIDDPR